MQTSKKKKSVSLTLSHVFVGGQFAHLLTNALTSVPGRRVPLTSTLTTVGSSNTLLGCSLSTGLKLRHNRVVGVRSQQSCDCHPPGEVRLEAALVVVAIGLRLAQHFCH